VLPRLMAVLQTAAFLFRHGAKLAAHTGGLAFPTGLEPAYLRVRSALLIQLSYGKMNMALPAGLEPASTAREAGILAARRWQPVDFFRPQWKLLPVRRPKSGPRSEVVDWLPPHDSNVPSSVNSGAPSPRWLDGNEMVEQRRVELRTSILQGSTAARCRPEMVPSARFELASCALQARAITRFANWARWRGRR
jgi:hypothetical protein